MNDAAREFVLAPSASASEALGKVPKCYVPAYVQEQHEREMKTRWRINNTQPNKKGGGTERRMWKQDIKEEPSNATANVNSTLRLTEDKLVRPNSVLLSNLSVSAKEKEDKQYKEVELRALRDRLRFKQKGASQRGGSAGSSSQGGSVSPSSGGGRLGSPFGPFLSATVLDANDAGARERRAAGWLEKKSNASRHAPILIQSTKLYGGLQKAWRSGDVQHTPFSTITPASGTVQDIHRPVLVDAPASPGSTPSSPNRHTNNITSSPTTIRRQIVIDQQLQDPRVDLDGECSSSSDDGHRKVQGGNTTAKKVANIKKKSPMAGKVNHNNNGGGSSSDDETTAADNKAKARVMLSFDMEQIGGGQFAQVGRSAPSTNNNTTHPPNQPSRDVSNSKLSKRRAERKMQKDLRRFEAYNPNVIMPSLRDQMSKLAFSPTSTSNKVDPTASLDIPSLGSFPTTSQEHDLGRRASSSSHLLSREGTVAQSPQRVIDRLVFEDSSDEEYFVETINKERDRLERKMESRAAATSTRRAGLSTRPTSVVPQHLKPIDHGSSPTLLQSNGLMQQKSHDQIAKDLALRATTYFPESDLQRLTEETQRLRGQNILPRTGSTVTGGIRRVESSAQLVRRVSGLGQFLSNTDDQSPPKGQKSVNFVNSINLQGSSPATNSLLPGGELTPTANIGGAGGILKQQPVLSDISTVDTPNGSHTVSPNASFSLRPQQSASSYRSKAQVGTRGPSPTHGGPISLDPSDASSILRELYFVSCPTHEDREGAYVSALGGLSFNMDFPKFKKLVRGLIPHPTSGSNRGSPNNNNNSGSGCQHYQPISDDVALAMFAVIIENSSHLQQSAHTFLPQGGHGGQRNGSQQQGGNISAMMEASVEEVSNSNSPAGSPSKLSPSMSLSTANSNPPVSSPFGHRQLPSGLSASSTLPPALQVTITYVRFLSGLCQSVLSPAQLKFVDNLYIAVVNSPHVGYYLYHLKYQVVHRMRAKLDILRQHRAALQQAMHNEMDGMDTSAHQVANSPYIQGKQARGGGGTLDVFASATSIPADILDGFDPENWLLIGSLGDRMPIPSSALSAPKGGGGGNGRVLGGGGLGGGVSGNNDALVDTPRRSRIQRTNSVASTNSRISSVNGASPIHHHHHHNTSRTRGDGGSPLKGSPRNGGRVAEINYAQMFQDRLRSEVSKLMTLASSLEFTLIGDPLGDTLRIKSYFITRRRNRERVQHLLHEQQQQQRRVALEQLSRKQQEHRKKQMRKQHRHGDDDDDDGDDEENGLEAELLALMEESMINFDITKGSGGTADDESLNLLALAGGVHDELLGGPDCVALQRSAPVIPNLTKLGAVFVPPTAMTTPGGPSPSSKRLLTPITTSSPSGGHYGSLAAKPPAEAALVNYFRYRKETDIISDVIATLEAQLDLIKTRSAMVSGRPGSGGGSPGAAGAGGGGGGGLQGGLYTVAAMDDVFRAPQNGISRVGNGGSRSVVTGLYQPFTPGEDVSRPDLLLSLFLPGAPPKPSDASSSSSTPSSSSTGHRAASGQGGAPRQDGRASPSAGGGRRDSMMVTSMPYDDALVGGASSSPHATESPLASLSAARPGVKFATFVVRDAVFNLKGVSMQFPHPEEDAFVAAVMNCLCEAAIDTSANLLQDQLNIRTSERECEEAEEKALVALEAALRSSLIGEDIAARDGPQASSTHSPIRHHPFGSRSVMSENESQNSHSTQSRGGGGSTPLQKVRLAGKGGPSPSSRPVSLSTRPPTSTLSTRKRIGTASSVGTGGVTGRASVSSLSQMTAQGGTAASGGKSNTMGGGGGTSNHQGNPWSGQTLSEKSKHYNTAIYEAAPLAPPPLAHLSLDDFRMLLFCDNDVMNALVKIVPAGSSPVSGIFGPPPPPPS